MDVICLSSDSEASNDLDETIKYSKPINLEDDVFVVDWNDDYYSPVVDGIEPTETNFVPSPFPINVENQNMGADSGEKLSTSRYDISEFSSSDNDDNGLNANATLTQGFKDHFSGLNTQTNVNSKKPRAKLSQEQREATKVSKEQKKAEKEKLREEKKAEQQRQKAFKAVFVENQRQLKPEENIKFLKVHIDTEIINSQAGGNLIILLQQNNIQYAVESQTKSKTITWSKKRTTKELDDYGNVREIVECTEEKEMVYVLEWKEAVKLIHSSDLLSHIETIKSVYPDKNLTLFIYGLQKYFDFLKSKRKNQGKAKKYTETEKEYADAPKITYDQLEFALTDLQLFGKHNTRLIESPEELSTVIYNMTKSLSQLDYKMNRQKREEEDLDWFAKGDSCQSVKVDKNGGGLANLWRQQICQFASVGLETAQAIASQYTSPLSLVTKYRECGADGELLLQNLQIRRDLGLLSSTRRVGPQLSKKIYRFFTTDDPGEEL